MLPSLPLFTWDLSPIFFSIGFLSIRWYGVFFATGVLVFSHLIEKDPEIQTALPNPSTQDWIIFQAIFCTILGAKLGYVFLYTAQSLWLHTLTTLQGFSFHGGLIGLLLYFIALSFRYKSQCLLLMDRFAVHVPWSLALGRLGNFFNSELIGRPTDQTWGVFFPYAESNPIARHPSQLYECLGEGVILGILLLLFDRYTSKSPYGLRSAAFLVGYGSMRLFLEQFRQPDPQIGFIGQGWTLGQILCAIMIGSGLALWVLLSRVYRTPQTQG